MATKRKRKKGIGLFVITVPLVLMIAYFAVKPDRWYMLTAGTGRQEISVRKRWRKLNIWKQYKRRTPPLGGVLLF